MSWTERNVDHLIDNMKHVTGNDIKILKQLVAQYTPQLQLLQQLSFYSTKFQINTIDNYNYIQTPDNEDIYKYNNILFDSNKKIIYMDTQMYNDSKKMVEFLYWFFNNDFHRLDDIISNNYNIGNNIILVQTWSGKIVLYGHFLDEVYTLYDFNLKLKNNKNEDYRCLYYYPNTSCNNYDIIVNKIFTNSEYINYNKYKYFNKCVKMK